MRPIIGNIFEWVLFVRPARPGRANIVDVARHAWHPFVTNSPLMTPVMVLLVRVRNNAVFGYFLCVLSNFEIGIGNVDRLDKGVSNYGNGN